MRSFNKEKHGALPSGQVEDALCAYYRAQRPAADEASERAVVAAVVEEVRNMRAERAVVDEARCLRAEMSPVRVARPTFSACVRAVSETASFVAAQARFMGARAWILQACAVAAVVLLWSVGEGHAASGLYACLAGAAIAVCGLPDMAASRMCGIVELERSCMHDARSVAAARMAVLACSNAVGLAAVALAGAFADPAAGAPVALLHAFAPYCITVAGCLAAARRIDGTSALVAAAAWGVAVAAGAYFLAAKMPGVYDQAAVWVWAAAAAAAAVWAGCEARAWLADAAASPRMLSFDSSFINR